jgi:hypothetical protein
MAHFAHTDVRLNNQAASTNYPLTLAKQRGGGGGFNRPPFGDRKPAQARVQLRSERKD